MEVVQFLQEMNATLDQFVWFRMFKFVLALYLLIMTAATALMIYQLIKKAYFTVIATGQDFKPIEKGSYLQPWKEVVGRVRSGNPNDWKIAVIEATEMINRIFTQFQYPGDTLGQKLEQMNDQQVPNLNELKEVVKMRNQIVQDPAYQPTQEEATAAVESVGKTLQFFWAI